MTKSKFWVIFSKRFPLYTLIVLFCSFSISKLGWFSSSLVTHEILGCHDTLARIDNNMSPSWIHAEIAYCFNIVWIRLNLEGTLLHYFRLPFSQSWVFIFSDFTVISQILFMRHLQSAQFLHAFFVNLSIAKSLVLNNRSWRLYRLGCFQNCQVTWGHTLYKKKEK